MSSDTPSDPAPEDIQVRLKPFLGIEPKHYLAGIYGFCLLAALGGLTLGPGLSHPGTRVTVTSTPAGASVTWAGKHYGTTPVTAFFPEGSATLEVGKPGFLPVRKDYSSGNNVFLSLFFPRSDAVDVTLDPAGAESVGSFYRSEVGRWALAVPFTSDYRFPPLFTRLVTDARAAGWDQDRIRTFLMDLRPLVADPQMYLDYGRALGLWAPDAPAPEGLEAQFKLWSPLLHDSSDRLAFWLLANQTKPLRDRETTDTSDWFKARISGFQGSLKAAAASVFAPGPAALKTAAGTFRGIGPATFLWASAGDSFTLPTEPPFTLPVPVSTAAFWIADAEVTQAQFAAFTAANPAWAPSARATLVSQGLADDDYLVSWSGDKPNAGAEPVSSVSWYAAQAYVRWLNASGQVPPGRQAVLPTEFQWEAAARSPGGSTLLNQGVWEWTATAYAPGDGLVWSEAAEAPEGYARSIKGGVTLAKGSVKAGDRAGWPASGSTTELGFRVALIGAP